MRPPSVSSAPHCVPSVDETVRRVSAGERSPVEVVQETLDAISAADPEIRAFLTVDADGALAQAAALAARIARGERPGALAGVPVAVKDLEDAAGLRTTFGDLARAAAAPAVRDSIQVARLRAAGAVVVGKTTTPQYGWKGETDSPLFGVTRNPCAPARTPGGSSGGSAAALAAGMVPLATGSDGGGSIRIPASCCGLAGLKPTTGVVPAGDDEAPAWGPLATRGPMARTFAEVAVALDVVSGPTHRDPTALPPLGSFTAAAAAPSVEGLRVAWSPTLGYATPTPAVLKVCEAAVERLEQLGAVVEPLDRVFTGAPLKAWLTLVSVGLRRELRNHRDVPRRGDLDDAAGRLDGGLLAMVERAAATTAEQYIAAAGTCHAVSLQLAAVWERFDLLACPVTADVAPRLDGGSVLGDWAQCTYPFNLARSPAASVPAGVAEVDGDLVPVGLQLAAPRLHDLRLLRAAAALEATADVTPR